MSEMSEMSYETPFYFVDALDENITEYLNDVVQLKLEDEQYKMKERLSRISLQQKSQTSQKILNIVLPLFQKAGLTVNSNNGYITYFSYDYNCVEPVNNGHDISAESADYYDDVNVCYLVTQKDQNIKGGNMDVYNEYPSFLQLIGYKKEEKETVNLNKGTVFITKGEVYDKLQECSGNGHLNMIKVVLYEKSRFGYRDDNDDDGVSNF